MTDERHDDQDSTPDYKDLDDTAASTAPDDLGGTGDDPGLTAGGMGTGVDDQDSGKGGM